MNAYRIRCLSGRLDAASNSSSHSLGISGVDPMSVFYHICIAMRIGVAYFAGSSHIGPSVTLRKKTGPVLITTLFSPAFNSPGTLSRPM